MMSASAKEGLKASNESGEKGIPDLRLSAGAEPGCGLKDLRIGVRAGLIARGVMLGTEDLCARLSWTLCTLSGVDCSLDWAVGDGA